MYEKIIFIVALCLFSVSCATTRILSDNRERNREYREIQSEIRNGETELAITDTEIKNTVNRLEQSIKESEETESEIGEILQRIRTRKIPIDKLNEFGDSETK